MTDSPKITTDLQLPEASIDLLNGRHQAQKIAESCAVAFWLHGRDDDTALFHMQAIHTEFAALAAQLGYSVQRVSA